MKNLGRPLRRTEPQLKPRSLVELLSRLLGGDCQEVLHMGSINPPKKRDYGKNTRIDVTSCPPYYRRANRWSAVWL
jgi:hypothetical protein